MAARYDGKPLLKLLDCYVLSSMGHLPHEQDFELSLIAPKISQALGARGSWFEMVAEHMGFDDQLPLKIKAIWGSNEDRAKAQGASLDPIDFAREFVDVNFSAWLEA